VERKGERVRERESLSCFYSTARDNQGLLEALEKESSTPPVLKFESAKVKQARVTMSNFCCAIYGSSESQRSAMSESQTLLYFGAALHNSTYTPIQDYRKP
jgi:hypothetical protein